MNYDERVAKNIRAFRKLAGFTQAELAFRANISTNHLGRIERRQCSPTVNTLIKLAEQFNISPARFFH